MTVVRDLLGISATDVRLVLAENACCIHTELSVPSASQLPMVRTIGSEKPKASCSSMKSGDSVQDVIEPQPCDEEC